MYFNIKTNFMHLGLQWHGFKFRGPGNWACHVTVPGYLVDSEDTILSLHIFIFSPKNTLICLTKSITPKLSKGMLKKLKLQGCMLRVSSANNSHFGSDSISFRKIEFPPDTLLQGAVEDFKGGQEQEETDLEDSCSEIVEQTHLDHFISVLQNAQKAASLMMKEKDRKCRKPYNGRSKTTQKQRRKQKKDLAKQGYLSVLEFIAHMKEKAKKWQTEKPVTEEAETGIEQCPQELEESALDAEDSSGEDSNLVSWSVPRHVVHHEMFLMWSG